MTAVLLTGYGGLDKLEYRDDVPVPLPGPGEVLINVTASGMNNTDINTRTGWYSPSVQSGTTAEGGAEGFGVEEGASGSWTGDVGFPRIQGADLIGRIAAVGSGVDAARVGQKVTCDPYFRDQGDETGLESKAFLGSECNGSFAQFTVVPAENTYQIPEDTGLSDEAIATLPCSGGTAMNMLLMAGVKAGDRVLVTGASGGVGSLLVQIAKHLGAVVVAVASASKHAALLELGADACVDRAAEDHATPALAALEGAQFTVVADVVGGDRFSECLSVLGRGGRYVTAGAIAGPIVELDLRTLYLKSLEFFGSSAYRRDTFPALMQILAEGGLKPAVASVRPLSEIHEAQTAFLEKSHVGSLILVPPKANDQV
ncbi:MAG: zinc-binding dehydrogenase [Alphaproteobacteria bacterium]|nr:zinc-binding dehydrogenase [Alphaproteobacteria bacterium]